MLRIATPLALTAVLLAVALAGCLPTNADTGWSATPGGQAPAAAGAGPEPSIQPAVDALAAWPGAGPR